MRYVQVSVVAVFSRIARPNRQPTLFRVRNPTRGDRIIRSYSFVYGSIRLFLCLRLGVAQVVWLRCKPSNQGPARCKPSKQAFGWREAPPNACFDGLHHAGACFDGLHLSQTTWATPKRNQRKRRIDPYPNEYE